MDAPEARYLERDGATLAYQVVGERGADVLVVGEIAMHFDLSWTDPHFHELYERGATYSRTVYMQARGFGLSERLRYTPTVEQHADDVLAVIEAAGLQRPTVVGVMTTCAAIALAAAQAPELVSSLVLYRPFACGPLAPAATSNGWNEREIGDYVSRCRAAFARWGSGASIDVWDPALNTSYNRRFMAMLERCSATPAGARAHLDYHMLLDVNEVWRGIQVPTRVVWSPTAPEPHEVVHRVAELIPEATLHESVAPPAGASIGEAWTPVGEHTEEMATGAKHSVEADRFLGTVLFTDVVASTETLARIGDVKYRELLGSYERRVRHEVERAGGRLVSITGDGTLSVFDGPSKAVRCGEAICRGSTEQGFAIRAGVHTGELERNGRDVTGLSVHIGARVAAAAGAGETFVSRTVHDLVAGAGLSFASRGRHQLKGVPGDWELYALTATGTHANNLSAETIETALDRVAVSTARRAPRLARAAVRLGNAMQRRKARSA